MLEHCYIPPSLPSFLADATKRLRPGDIVVRPGFCGRPTDRVVRVDATGVWVMPDGPLLALRFKLARIFRGRSA